MMEYTDKQIAEQLQELYQKIIAGISYAEDVLKKTQQINSATEDIKLEISAITADSKNIENNVKHWQTEIQAIHHNIVKIGSEITNNQAVELLQQEFIIVRHKLNEFQIKIQQTEKDKTEIFASIQQLESKFNEIVQVISPIEQLRKMETIIEIMATEVSNVAIEVKADRALFTSIKRDLEDISIIGDNSMKELHREIEYLQQHLDHNLKEIGIKLQTQAKNQQRLRNWLFVITFGVACLGFVFMLVN